MYKSTGSSSLSGFEQLYDCWTKLSLRLSRSLQSTYLYAFPVHSIIGVSSHKARGEGMCPRPSHRSTICHLQVGHRLERERKVELRPKAQLVSNGTGSMSDPRGVTQSSSDMTSSESAIVQ
jgi:hypothetical protein